MTLTAPNPVESPPVPTVALHLLNAATFLAEHGLCQGEFIGTDGSVCAVGAIFCGNGRDPYASDSVTDGGWKNDPAVLALARYLDIPNGELVPEWNDETERTEEEVVLTLRAAAFAEMTQVGA